LLQVALTLYCYLGQHLLLQLETFITHIVLKLAEGKGIVKIEQQEAALEVQSASICLHDERFAA
jgi:golgi-specific brefeldin A-resistance guanine nucleotide exchange factor 1